MQKIFFLFSCLIFLLNTSFGGRKGSIEGLYISKFPDVAIANYILIGKKGAVSHLTFRKIESASEIIKDMKENAVFSKYVILKDSIFFKFDSLYLGKSTITYTAFGKYHEEYTNFYSPLRTEFFVKIKGDSLFCKVSTLYPREVTDMYGGVSHYGESDSTKWYESKYVKIK